MKHEIVDNIQQVIFQELAKCVLPEFSVEFSGFHEHYVESLQKKIQKLLF
jgi:hypothetical protein